jgi:hypothetical protein
MTTRIRQITDDPGGVGRLEGKRIAYLAAGRPDVLYKLLEEVGAHITKTRVSDTRGNVQVSVKFADGSMGFFNPGGPSRMITYSFHEGHRPGDEGLRGVLPSELPTAKRTVRGGYAGEDEFLYEGAPSLPPGSRRG